MGFGTGFQKMRDRMKIAMRDKVAKVKEEAIKAEKERDDKGLTTQEYIDAKSNGTLASLPIVSGVKPLGEIGENSDNTTLYIALGLVLLVGLYVYKSKK